LVLIFLLVYLATDINPHACRCTSLTGRQNNVDIDVVNSSFATPFYSRLCRKVDVLLFNPPYVPTPDEEAHEGQTAGNIGGSWAGGSEGMKVTNIMLDQVEVMSSYALGFVLFTMCHQRLLSPKGRFYLVALKQNNIQQIIDSMKNLHGLEGEVSYGADSQKGI
jgi:release factor glutamine methyltransferase